jgi:hypothetical protein
MVLRLVYFEADPELAAVAFRPQLGSESSRGFQDVNTELPNGWSPDLQAPASQGVRRRAWLLLFFGGGLQVGEDSV